MTFVPTRKFKRHRKAQILKNAPEFYFIPYPVWIKKQTISYTVTEEYYHWIRYKYWRLHR